MLHLGTGNTHFRVIGTLPREVTVIFAPLLKKDLLYRKEFPTGNKCFPFRVDHFSEGDRSAGEKTRSDKSCLIDGNSGNSVNCNLGANFFTFIVNFLPRV